MTSSVEKIRELFRQEGYIFVPMPETELAPLDLLYRNRKTGFVGMFQDFLSNEINLREFGGNQSSITDLFYNENVLPPRDEKETRMPQGLQIGITIDLDSNGELNLPWQLLEGVSKEQQTKVKGALKKHSEYLLKFGQHSHKISINLRELGSFIRSPKFKKSKGQRDIVTIEHLLNHDIYVVNQVLKTNALKITSAANNEKSLDGTLQLSEDLPNSTGKFSIKRSHNNSLEFVSEQPFVIGFRAVQIICESGEESLQFRYKPIPENPTVVYKSSDNPSKYNFLDMDFEKEFVR